MKKVVLITGASSGIGKETAKLLTRNEYVVYGAARSVERMHDLKEAGVRILSMDVSNDDSILKGISEILNNEKRIDVLINNAGYGSYGAVEDVPISEARYQFEVNVFGLARLTQLVLPHMRKQHSGKIINISSVGGRLGEPHGAWYHATKFAVEGLSDSLRMELKQFNIDVVVIQPGAIKTEWNRISRENLVKRSENTVYGNLVKKHARALEKVDNGGSEPIVIAKVILNAIISDKPRIRYAAGSQAKMVLFMKRILSDRMFDKLMLSQMK